MFSRGDTMELKDIIEQLKDSEGNLLYYQTDVNGNINTDIPPVPESELKSAIKIPFV